MAFPEHGILPDLPPVMQDNPPKTPSVGDRASEDGGDYCRICRGEALPDQPLFYPCKCSGSIRFVHQDCLMQWLAHSKKKYCELCKTPFRFTKLYDKSMPAVLPIPLFLRQLVLHFFQGLTRWARYSLVAAIWCIGLPWCMRQVWRGLFWLADGSWLSDAELHRSEVRQLNASISQLKTAMADQGFQKNASAVFDLLLNSTDKQTDDMQASDSMFGIVLRFMSGETLASKILRILFSIPPLQFSISPTTNRTQLFAGRRSLQRPPSLLSDMKLVKAFSSSPLLNHVTLDVLEGILICLGLVAGFILIFLIREWVINQQPMLNIPDPDVADHAPPAAAPVNERRPIIRPRRRRIIPRVIDQAPRAGGDANNVDVQGLPVRPRRALTDDNIGRAVATGLERPAFPVRSQSLATGWSETDADVFRQLEERESPSPPPLLRGAIGEAVNVHRAIEEAPIALDGRELHPSRLLEDPTSSMPSSMRLRDVNEIPAGPLRRPSTPVVQFQPEVEVIGTSSNRSSIVIEPESQPSSDSDHIAIATPDSSDSEEPDDVSDTSGSDLDVTSPSGDSPPQDLTALGGEENTSDFAVSATGADAGTDIIEVPAFESEESTSEDDDQAIEAEDPHIPHPPRSSADRFADWLWRVEAPVPTPATPASHDEDQVGAYGPIDAPLLPVNDPGPPGELEPFDGHAGQPNLEQALLPPNAGGIDWNDPNAADEIEDLEGILELIGMEGPFMGMIQNVVFSLFLITVTLTGSVWIPYIWGKITLLLIANPVVVVIKAPTFLFSNTADLVADLVLFVLGLLGLLFNSLTKVVKAVTAHIFPTFSRLLDTELFEELALNATHQSGSRLEKTLTATAMTLSPDLPAFSIQSHRALVSFKTALRDGASRAGAGCLQFCDSISWPTWSIAAAKTHFYFAAHILMGLPAALSRMVEGVTGTVRDAFSVQVKPLVVDTNSIENIELVEWKTQDKVIAIIMGYAFFALLGYVFLKVAHLVLGLRKDEKVEGPVADGLRQAGGVLKVIVIIGIEMIVFPLYCGLLLDLALLPLFEGATVQTRLAFIMKAPFTGLFLHWFVGTCYMFHFALFVSICRKILRKGVLYFIRDPDDPTFHPVRDVLERPVPTQLGKIAFSALVYGGLVILCLGGVVWGVGRMDGVLPIRWTTPEPRLAFPVDVLFYNFMLPFIVRRVEPSKKVSAVYEWWFRGCAHGLRLTQFLFGEEREDEKVTRLPWRRSTSGIPKDGTYVRAPAADSCRIPKDKKVFLEVNEDNERIDGQPDNDKGLHGKTDDKWTKLYLPPQFQARVATFVVLLWMFAAGTGVAFTIGPLLLGRSAVKWLAGSPGPVNDLYAFTMGIHLIGASGYAIVNIRPATNWLLNKPGKALSDFRSALPRLWSTLKQIAGLVYLFAAFGLVFPFTLSLIAELYVHIPILTYLMSGENMSADQSRTDSPNASLSRWPPTVFFLQTWTLGLLYLRLAFRIALNYPCPHTRLSTAIRAIFRNGYLRPDVRLASRAIILPLTGLCIVLLGAPVLYARAMIILMRVTDPDLAMRVYRMAFPGLMWLAFTACVMMSMKRRLEIWRVKIKDEVYLVGERLHNYVDKKERRRRAREKGKEKAL